MEGFSDAYFLSSRLIQGSRRTFKEHFVWNLVIILNSFYLNQTSSKFISVPACEININCQIYGLFKGSILRVTVIYNHFIDVRVCNDCYNFPLKLWMWFFLVWLIPDSAIPIAYESYDMRVSSFAAHWFSILLVRRGPGCDHGTTTVPPRSDKKRTVGDGPPVKPSETRSKPIRIPSSNMAITMCLFVGAHSHW